MENVLLKIPHLQSRACLVLLKKDLLRKVAYVGYQGWLRFRWELLHKWLDERGELICYYCGKHALLIDEDNSHPDVATLDHFIPISKGGAVWDVKNLVVACYKCNQRKRDKIYAT